MAAKKRPGQQIARRYPPYLLARQIAALKKLSDDTETLVQHHIRQAIDEYLERRKKNKTRPLCYRKLGRNFATASISRAMVQHPPSSKSALPANGGSRAGFAQSWSSRTLSR